MASDNLRAGLTGGLNAVQDILGLLIRDKFDERRDVRTTDRALAVARAGRIDKRADKTIDTDEEIRKSLALLPHQEASRIRVAQATPGMVYDESSGTFMPAPSAGRIFTARQSFEEKEDIKREALKKKAKPKERSSLSALIDETADFKKNIADLLAKPLSKAAGRVKAPKMLSGDRRNIESLLTSLKAKTGFATLQDMRNNSPTGGALGQISDREMPLLQNKAAAIDLDQQEDQLRKNLLELYAQADRTLKRHLRRYEEYYGEPFAGGSDPRAINEQVTNGGGSSVSAGDLQVGKDFGGGKISKVEWEQ